MPRSIAPEGLYLRATIPRQPGRIPQDDLNSETGEPGRSPGTIAAAREALR
jgi:hypothetical protein